MSAKGRPLLDEASKNSWQPSVWFKKMDHLKRVVGQFLFLGE